VHPSVGVKDVRELVAKAKAQPGKLNFAVSGIGGAPHLAGIEFAQRMGLQWTYIPYKGGSDAVAAVAAGQADVLFNGMLATWPTVQGGRIKALAISSAQRVPSAPDTPTVAEQGLPGFETGSFQGFVGPAGIAHDIVAKLNGELVRVLNTADMKERFAKQGTEVRTGTPDSLGRDGYAVVSFRLPAYAEGLPLPEDARVEREVVSFETATPTRDLAPVLAWASGRGMELEGLSVGRPTLEDVYLQLTEETR